MRSLREALRDKRGSANAFAKPKFIKGEPIGFLRNSDGRVASHPGELDEILRSAWEPVYAGNAVDHKLLVAHYLQKYCEHLFIVDEPALPATAGSRLQEEFRQAAASAASWDQWQHDEWAALPLEVVEQAAAVHRGRRLFARPDHVGHCMFSLQGGGGRN